MSKGTLKYWKNNRTWTHPITGTKYAKGLMGICRQICINRATNEKDELICEKCGCVIYRKADMHHLWGKNLYINVTLYWEPEMCCIVHMRCHRWGTHDALAAHDDDGAFRDFMVEKRGESWYNGLMEKYHTRMTWNQCDPASEEERLLTILREEYK